MSQSKKHEIVICMGSSCFSRGNKKVVATIQDYLEKNNLKEQVKLRGAHCFGNCVNGPNLIIDNTMFNNINSEKIVPILDTFFKDNK